MTQSASSSAAPIPIAPIVGSHLPGQTGTVTNPVHVRILAVNDFHGQLADSDARAGNDAIGGAATLAAYLNRARAEDPGGTVLLSVGDAFGASPPESTLLDHTSTIAALTAMGLNVATLGNHEFDRGLGEALRIILGGRKRRPATKHATAATPRSAASTQSAAGRGTPKRAPTHPAPKTDPAPPPAPLAKRAGADPAWPGSPFPWVSANVVDAKTRRPILPPYLIMEVGGVKVAFVGAVTRNLKNVTVAKGIKDVVALDPATAINHYVPELKAKGVRTIVAFVHEGGELGQAGNVTGPIVDLVKRLDKEVDVVASAHSHKEYSTRIDGRIVTQAGSYAKAFAQIDLLVDPATGDTVAGSSQIVRNREDGIAPDPTVTALVDLFKHAVAPKTERLISTLPGAITKQPNTSGESALGTLIAEAQRGRTGAQIGLMNTGGIRQDITAGGPITWGRLFNVQPFANRVIKIALTGAKIRKTLEDCAAGKAGGHGMAQVAGMRVVYDSRRPAGHRVVSVTLDDGSPLHPNRTYTVAANSFIADGGDGFVELGRAKRLGDFGVDLDALVAYLAAGRPVPTGPVGHLVDLGHGGGHDE